MKSEFKLIERIKKLPNYKHATTVLGTGDDCAILQLPTPSSQRPNSAERDPATITKILQRRDKQQIQNPESQNLQLVTADALVEGVHFHLRHTSYRQLGKKALAVNISDIAAMGGTPAQAVVTIGIPPKFKENNIITFARSLFSEAKRYKIEVVGGDVVSSPRAFWVSIYLLGTVKEKNLIKRSGAKVGDLVFVTGPFGLAASTGYKANRHPVRLKEGQALGRSGLASSMIDASDGLARSVHEICKASRVGARINFEKVPVARGANLDQALYGGEDYELVFTAPKRYEKRIKKIVKCKVVGEIVSRREGINIKEGYEHFKQN